MRRRRPVPKNLQYDFLKMRGLKDRLELFRKFICFGSLRLPLYMTDSDIRLIMSDIGYGGVLQV